MEVEANTSGQTQAKTKFCKHCGGTIPQDAVMCTHCGRQVEELAGAAQPQVVIQNTNMNTNTAAAVVAGVGARAKNKWTAFVLCLLLGSLCVRLRLYLRFIGLVVLNTKPAKMSSGFRKIFLKHFNAIKRRRSKHNTGWFL